MKYTAYSKEIFWKRLSQYRDALRAGTKKDIILTSLAIHAALSNVPKSYKAYVNQAYRDTTRDSNIPLT